MKSKDNKIPKMKKGGGKEDPDLRLRKKDIKVDDPGDNIFKTFLNMILNNNILLTALLVTLLSVLIFYIYKFNPFKIATMHSNAVLMGLAFLVTILIGSYMFIINYKTDVNSGNDVDYKTDVNSGNDVDYISDKEVNTDMGNFFLKMFTTFGMIGGILGAIYGIYWMLNNVKNPHKLITWSFIAISIITGLGIIYLIYEQVIDPKESYTNEQRENNSASFFELLKEFFFFIPCLLIDLIEYFEKQIGLTTNPIWILLIIELVIIVFYFVLPLVASSIILHEGKEILKGPIYTDSQKVLGTYQSLSGDSKINYNYNYGISCWIYINPQPTSTSSAYTKYTSLLNYANKPNILYNAKENTIRIECQNKKNDLETIYEMKNIGYQKWMHFVINYSSGIVDVFIDNELVASVGQIAPYMTMAKVTSGENNGIHGGIKNVVYFKKPISKTKMDVLTYEMN